MKGDLTRQFFCDKIRRELYILVDKARLGKRLQVIIKWGYTYITHSRYVDDTRPNIRDDYPWAVTIYIEYKQWK